MKKQTNDFIKSSVLIISSFSFSRIRDFPPQLINAFSLVRKKSLSLLHEDGKVKENTIKRSFFIVKSFYT